MIISVPITFSFQRSNVPDTIKTLPEFLRSNHCKPPTFFKGQQLRHGNWIYEYTSDVPTTPRAVTDKGKTDGIYDFDETCMFEKSCVLARVTGKRGLGIVEHRVPAQPEWYPAHDSGFDHTHWHNRYVEVNAETNYGWLANKWLVGNVEYSFSWNGVDQAWHWVVRDIRATGSDAFFTSRIATFPKFYMPDDIDAEVIEWAPKGLSKNEVIIVKSMIERLGKYYVRTNVDIPVYYAKWEQWPHHDYMWGTVHSPYDIDGFVQRRMVNSRAPFDGKQYTKCEVNTSKINGEAYWELLANEDFDTVAFGRVIADSLSFRITDQSGKLLFALTDYEVDNTIDPIKDKRFAATAIVYTDKIIPAGSVIRVSLKGQHVSIGEIQLGYKYDAGFTKLAFKNKFKDFSPKEQDQWGNWYYTDGIRVHVHTGTVEYEVVEYDRLVRLMMMIGGNYMIINGSDTYKNAPADGENIFAATMLIGRFTTFELGTKEEKKRLGDRAYYTFQIEEIV